MKYYLITRKEDGYRIKSKKVNIIDIGVWINDDLEAGREDCKIFIPWHNILQINEYLEDEVKVKCN